MDSLAFLDRVAKLPPQPVYVLHGDEDFLKRQVRAALLPRLLGDADPDFAGDTYAGDQVEFARLRDELDTLPFVGPRRVVAIEQADGFVTRYRPQLEKYLAAPSATGTLILEVKTLPATTKLAKALPDEAAIACKSPGDSRLADWCVRWAKARYSKRLEADAAGRLVELIGPSMGQLDQELAKLAMAAGDAPAIIGAIIERLVSRSRNADVFKIMTAVGAGRPGEALAILNRLFAEGEDALAVLGALGAQLRKLARVARLNGQGVSLGVAMDREGVPKWPQARQDTERQLKHLGRRRLEKLYDWLLEVDTGLKGGSPLPPRAQMERLVVRLARSR